jgi:predicted transcriptional regulator
MSVVTARISDELNKSLFTIAKKIERPKSYIIAKAIEAYVQELQEDIEDYNDAIEILAQNNRAIPLEELIQELGLENDMDN